MCSAIATDLRSHATDPFEQQSLQASTHATVWLGPIPGKSAGRFPSMGANMLAYLSKRGKKRTPYPLVFAYSGSEEARITVWRVGGLL